MNKDESKNITQSVSEPSVTNKKYSLKTFNSFEEMNEDDARIAANTSPIEHLKNTTELIKKVYNEELKTPFDKKIKFR